MTPLEMMERWHCKMTNLERLVVTNGSFVAEELAESITHDCWESFGLLFGKTCGNLDCGDPCEGCPLDTVESAEEWLLKEADGA